MESVGQSTMDIFALNRVVLESRFLVSLEQCGEDDQRKIKIYD